MNIVARFARFAAYRNTVRELKALDNRQLADVGIQRSEIEAVARGIVF